MLLDFVTANLLKGMDLNCAYIASINAKEFCKYYYIRKFFKENCHTCLITLSSLGRQNNKNAINCHCISIFFC